MNCRDSRLQYTKNMFHQALLKLMKKKNIAEITVKELCEEANISRNTFYTHYDVVNDVLSEIEDDFIEENSGRFASYMTELNANDFLSQIFGFLLENRELAFVLMGKNGHSRFIERIKEESHDIVLQSWKKSYPFSSLADLEYVYDYVFTGSSRMILDWMEDNHGMSGKDLARRLDCLGHNCIMAIKDFGK